MREQREVELECEREKRKIEKEKKDKERKELYNKYKQWYSKEYNSKTTGSNILLMYKTLDQIKSGYSLIGVRGKRGIFGDDWRKPTGLHGNVFHGLNQRIVDKALNELTEKKFTEFKIYTVIIIDPYTKIETKTNQKGIRIMKNGHIFLKKFKDLLKEVNKK